LIKQPASLDSSFWINACNAGIAEFLLDYYELFVCRAVADEILYPIQVLGMPVATAERFQAWLDAEWIILQEPVAPLEWFQVGENFAAALARERGYRLLIDDENPYHFAKAHGLRVLGTPDFVVALYLHRRLSYEQATGILLHSGAARHLKRAALVILGALAQERGER
jgi:predicted nucleic acid-binding protein